MGHKKRDGVHPVSTWLVIFYGLASRPAVNLATRD
jgi:hypothetical protein